MRAGQPIGVHMSGDHAETSGWFARVAMARTTVTMTTDTAMETATSSAASTLISSADASFALFA
jgi:hypothetical protein